MSARPLEQHYSTAEVAAMVGVCTETVLRAAARGELSSIRLGVRRRYSVSAIREWLDFLASPSPRRPAS